MPAVETSDMYMGTIIVSIPTDKPATARPIQLLPVTMLNGQNRMLLRLTTKQHTDGARASLQRRSKKEYNNSSQHRALPAKAVRNRSIRQRAKPCRQKQCRDKPALEAAVKVNSGEERAEVLHAQDA